VSASTSALNSDKEFFKVRLGPNRSVGGHMSIALVTFFPDRRVMTGRILRRLMPATISNGMLVTVKTLVTTTIRRAISA